ncbi:hypothetical protein PC39_13627 [Salinisphaera sp. PC39]|uniref:hypothetical protein n=1 Tax=Salinisphaera sp. PC39 TaxID=1304156 RepID=UPI003341A0BF
MPPARLALASGPLVIGHIGIRFRRSLSFIGPSINVAARILKLAPPDGIVATDPVFQHARRTDPDLAAAFTPMVVDESLKGVDADTVWVHLAGPGEIIDCKG